MPTPTTVYLRTRDGATHELSGRRLTKLTAAAKRNEAQPEIVRLVEAGYVDFFTADAEDGIDNLADYLARS